jgi:hypothetical protein
LGARRRSVGDDCPLSFILERALAIVMTHRWYVKRFHRKGLKTPLAFSLAAYVCVAWDFDALSMIVLTDAVTIPGMLITAAVIAGGSQGSRNFSATFSRYNPKSRRKWGGTTRYEPFLWRGIAWPQGARDFIDSMTRNAVLTVGTL